ncbi:RagB/SusD family nutrient uptake outer membrane protein [Ilyomonas limi]|uniref:RagB/SusD family nutrient uptake outer membrane protein n=1 Tax=Ilyomonas limi TaxID=2575867 RepID=A0A4U3KZV4_9BACT|nr:RagB/SusD family nutrient uptake outer membrane protein [Ilyomonas limi]TKK68341.1 RagB/SusD family nutrient uptake outer membrane protein [Ilyomonas limi]
MKKNFLNLQKTGASLVLIAAAFTFHSCSRALDEKVYSQVAVDQFYQTVDQAQLALNGVYGNTLWNDPYRDGQMITLGDVTAGTLTGGGSANGSGDRSGIITDWSTYTWTADAIELITCWNSFYQTINWDNTLIDKLANSPIPDASKASIDGQAKFLRAFFYFNLVRMFGGVPLYTNGTSDLSDAYKSRASEEEIYSQIIADLKEAQTELTPFNPGDQALGKATAASATALLAKVYLQQRNWTDAAAEAKKVIDMGYFTLMNDYENIFNPDFQNGPENLFSIQFGGNANSASQMYQTRLIYLYGPPAQTLPDGTNIQFHTLKDLVIFQATGDFFNSTPDTYRKWWTMRNRMPYYYKNGVSAANLVMDTVQMYAPFLTKFHRIDFSTGTLREGVNFPLIRYSDVLLAYAEALNEANGGPTAEAYNAINTVRRRARAVGTAVEQPESLYPDVAGLSQDQFRDSLLMEYKREFAGEGHYRWDLLRHDRLISDAKARGVTAADDKHKLFPIPAIQISRNETLEQNPGY